MSANQTIDFYAEPAPYVIEPERYEFDAAPRYRFDVDRREFFKVLGCGLVVILLAETGAAQESGNAGRRGGGGGRGGAGAANVSAFIHIGEDGAVTVFTGKTEIGQNIRTSLSQAVAEELRVPIAAVKLVMADTDLTPYDAGTFGSQSTPQMGAQLHRAAATAREALIDLAAEALKTDRANLAAADGKISVNGRAESVTYGQLTKGQKLVKPVGVQAPTTAPSDWKIAGQSVPKVNGRDFVTGRHHYTSDLKLEGMLHGKVLRPATLDGQLVSVDTKAAAAMEGVTVVQDGNFVGVTAPDTLRAAQAVEAIQAEWSGKPQPNSREIYDYLKQNLVAGRGRGGGGGGGGAVAPVAPMEATPGADHRLQQTYKMAYIAHTPLEPRAAVAQWKDGKATIWTGSQRPFGVRSDVAQAMGVTEEQVRVIVPDTGSGYGGKHTAEAAIEAARLAKAAGKPVKVVWTREEEFTWAYFRPAGVIDVTSEVQKDGTLVSWDFHNYHSGNAALQTPYDIPPAKKREAFHNTVQVLRTGSYRSLAAAANHFAREVHMDELAALVKLDPLEFRLKNLKNERLRAVFTAAAKAFGWGEAKPGGGRGFGIAGGTDKGSYVVTCAEVVTDRKSGGVKVARAVTAFECGAIVNPDQLKNQIEGGVVMGLGGALFEAIDFEKGMITNPHLADYRVPRFSDMPKLEVVLLDRKDLRSEGAGETSIVAIAPAIGNAIFNATGLRLRAMPLAPDGLRDTMTG